MPRSWRSKHDDKLTILFENISLGEGNIINIGDFNSDSINIGDGLAQCVGSRCVSKATKSWKTSSAKGQSIQDGNEPIAIDPRQNLDDVDSPFMTLRNLQFGEGNIVNVGDNNVISINIGDGASQCIGDECSSVASKRTEYASRAGSVESDLNMAKTVLADGVLTGSSKYPYKLVFKNVTYGYGNIINVGRFNDNGIVAGQGASQCVGYGCSSTSTGTFEVTNPAPIDEQATWKLLGLAFRWIFVVRRSDGSKQVGRGNDDVNVYSDHLGGRLRLSPGPIVYSQLCSGLR